MLTSFVIDGFRRLAHLELPRLERVNLVVGRNGVGKTTLLEALRVWAAGVGFANELANVLAERGEQLGVPDTSAVNVTRAFHREARGFRLGPQGGPELALRPVAGSTPSHLVFEGHFGDGERLIRQPFEFMAAPVADHLRHLPVQWVPAHGFAPDQVLRLWDGVYLTPEEDTVTGALNLVHPGITRLGAVQGTLGGDLTKRVPVALLEGGRGPVPLRALGEGTPRLFALALALVHAQGGLLLIDEVEAGLHHSVQVEVWRLIFEVAARLDVQVVATTHSWDCVSAFQQVSEAHPEEGLLLRLAAAGPGEAVVAWSFDEAELAQLTPRGIEVR